MDEDITLRIFDKLLRKILHWLSKYSPFAKGLFLFLIRHNRLPHVMIATSFNDVIFRRKCDLWFRKLDVYVDKILVRDLIRQKIGSQYLTKIYGVFENADELIKGNFSYPCVIKSNHASGHVLFASNYEDIALNKQVLEGWLAEDYFRRGGEPCYRNIPPRLFVEESLVIDGSPPLDYKFHCFGGKVRCIEVDFDRFGDHRRIHYSRDWDKQPFTFDYPLYEGDCEKPKQLELMITLAEKLSSPFKYLRVDLYEVKGNIFFGELTFFHDNAGALFSSDRWDKWLVSQYVLVNKNNGRI